MNPVLDGLNTMVAEMLADTATISVALINELNQKKVKVMVSAYTPLKGLKLDITTPKVVIPSSSLESTDKPSVPDTMVFLGGNNTYNALQTISAASNSTITAQYNGSLNGYENIPIVDPMFIENIPIVDPMFIDLEQVDEDGKSTIVWHKGHEAKEPKETLVLDTEAKIKVPKKTKTKVKTKSPISLYDGYPAPVDTPIGKSAGKGKLQFHYLTADGNTMCVTTTKVTKVSEQDAATILQFFNSFVCKTCLVMVGNHNPEAG